MIGLSPKELDCSTYYDIILTIQGYSKKQEDFAKLIRRASFKIFMSPHVKLKGQHTEEKFWRMKGDKMQTYSFKSKKKAFRELLNQVMGNGKV